MPEVQKQKPEMEKTGTNPLKLPLIIFSMFRSFGIFTFLAYWINI